MPCHQVCVCVHAHVCVCVHWRVCVHVCVHWHAYVCVCVWFLLIIKCIICTRSNQKNSLIILLIMHAIYNIYIYMHTKQTANIAIEWLSFKQANQNPTDWCWLWQWACETSVSSWWCPKKSSKQQDQWHIQLHFFFHCRSCSLNLLQAHRKFSLGRLVPLKLWVVLSLLSITLLIFTWSYHFQWP